MTAESNNTKVQEEASNVENKATDKLEATVAGSCPTSSSVAETKSSEPETTKCKGECSAKGESVVTLKEKVEEAPTTTTASSDEKKKDETTSTASKDEDKASSQKDDEDDEPDQEEVTTGNWVLPKVDVKPVEVVTGEEDETCIWKQRSKLYRWSLGEWKERGLGESKLLQHNTTHKIRFLLRQEKTLKVVANHYIVHRGDLCKLTPNTGSDKIWVWSVVDGAEDEPRLEQFGLKFGNLDAATTFKNEFEKAAAINDPLFPKNE